MYLDDSHNSQGSLSGEGELQSLFYVWETDKFIKKEAVKVCHKIISIQIYVDLEHQIFSTQSLNLF